jgi:hypothetical protein
MVICMHVPGWALLLLTCMSVEQLHVRGTACQQQAARGMPAVQQIFVLFGRHVLWGGSCRLSGSCMPCGLLGWEEEQSHNCKYMS